MYCWTWIVSIVLRIYASNIHHWYWPVIFFFFCGIFVWYWSQGDGGIREWVWKFSYNCNFVEHFQKVRCFVAIVFQSVSHIRLFVTPWTAAHQSPLSFTISQSWLKFMSIELVMLANHLILCWLLLLLPSIFPASGSFPVSHLCIRWPKYWNFSISSSNEYSGLISFRTDWFDYLSVKGTLKSLLQLYNLKASVLWHSLFFAVQLSHLSMTTGKTIALTKGPLLAKWCLCFLICCLGWS